MRNWLIYIASFIGALIATYGAFFLAVGSLWNFGEDVVFFVGMVFVPATVGLLAFAAIYGLIHRWRPSMGKLLLGVLVSNAMGVLAVLLIFSNTTQVGTAIGLCVLAAFLAGRYLTVRYGNG